MTDTTPSGNAESAESADNGADKYMVPALERGLRLLQEFGRGNATLGAPELARRLQLPRATIFRMLNTLEAMGFLQRAEGSNDYRLGLSVLRLGFEFLSSMDLTELGQPVIARLCGEIRYPCNIVVRDGRSIVYVAKVTPPTPLTSSVRVGTRLPAHATALGRVLLADLSLSELRTLYPEEHLEAHTPKTPRTVLDLFNLVEADREGFQRGRNLDKIGQDEADTSELFFNDVRVPITNCLGEEGQGFIYLMSELPQERLSIAVSAQAGAQRAFDEALAFTKDRKAFGKTVFDFQNTRFVLADLAAKLQAGWAHLDWCLKRHETHDLNGSQASAAKLWHTELLWEVCDKALQLHGGAGYMNEYMIARLWRDARVQRIYGGTTEIMKEVVGRSL